MADDAPFGIDRAFKDYFRMGGFDFDLEIDEVVEQALKDASTSPASVIEKLPLDRLSLLACDRQGLEPLELLSPSTVQQNTSALRATPRSGVAALRRILEAKQEADAARRMGKIRVAECERKSIMATLMSLDLSNMKRKLTKEENLLLWQLRQQDADARKRLPEAKNLSPEELEEFGLSCNDAAEADACDALLQWQSESDLQEKMHKARMAHVQRAAADEFERMKAIQHRSAVADVTEVLQRSVMEERMRRKEKTHREIVEQQNKARHEECQKAERAREQKRQLCTERFHENVRSRRRELESRAHYRDERSKQVQNERQDELAQRHARKAEEASKARMRLETVNESISEFRSLVEEEQKAKMELHESNKKQLLLRRRAARDMKFANQELHSSNVDRVQEAFIEEQRRHEQEVMEKEKEIELRKKAVKEAAEQRVRLLSAATDAALQRSQLKCRQYAEAQEERRKDLEMEYEAKSERIRIVEENRKVDRLIKAELEAQRIKHHEENRRRVEHAQAYQQMLKAELAEREEERDRQQKAAQERHKKDMADLATSLYKEREELAQVLEQSKAKFATMPTPATPQELGMDGSEARASSPVSRRRHSFGPTKEEIVRQAEAIAAHYMQSTSVKRSAGARSRPESAASVQRTHSVEETSSTQSTGSTTPVRHHAVTNAPRQRHRPLSAIGRRSPAPVAVTPHRDSHSSGGKLGNAFVPSPVVAKQLAEVDTLGDTQLHDEERRRCPSRPPSGKRANHVQSPVSELVQRMDKLYHA
jgi:hypothetical protein